MRRRHAAALVSGASRTRSVATRRADPLFPAKSRLDENKLHSEAAPRRQGLEGCTGVASRPRRGATAQVRVVLPVPPRASRRHRASNTAVGIRGAVKLGQDGPTRRRMMAHQGRAVNTGKMTAIWWIYRNEDSFERKPKRFAWNRVQNPPGMQTPQFVLRSCCLGCGNPKGLTRRLFLPCRIPAKQRDDAHYRRPGARRERGNL